MAKSQQLRFDFIGMAFALALGQVGVEIGEFYSSGLKVEDYLYVFTHLLLGTYIIASSWVGWNKSDSTGTVEKFNGNFGKPFIILLIDLFLVICYFIIVKGVEKPYHEEFLSNSISAQLELQWCIIVMCFYIFWDIMSKLVEFDSKEFNFNFQWKHYFSRAYQAYVCLILLLIIYYSIEETHSITKVILIDIYLLLIFVLFRGLKEKIKDSEKHHMVEKIKFIMFRILPLFGILILLFVILEI